MTVGASHGPFDVFLAGTDYRELLIIGPAASQVIHLEGEADKGETLVSDEIAATVPASMLGRRHAGGVALLGNPPDSPSVPETRQHGSARMEAFVPPQVIEQLGAFTELGGEHRLVSVGFVMVGGVEAALQRPDRMAPRRHSARWSTMSSPQHSPTASPHSTPTSLLMGSSSCCAPVHR